MAFGSTRKPGTAAEEDPGLAALLGAGTRSVAIFGKASAFHVEQVLRTSKEENLAMIRDSVRFLTERGREVTFDAEHFFDGWKDDPDYAEAVLKTAEAAGAATLVLCDTNGGTLPDEIFHIVNGLKGKTAAPLGIHCHNDAGCAVANSLMAVKAGVKQIQGTLLGFGERCGNANLSSILPTLQLGVCLRSGRVPSEPDPLRPGGGGGGERDPRSRASLCGEQRLRSQGRDAHRRGDESPLLL